MTYRAASWGSRGTISSTIAPQRYPRYHHGSWWAYNASLDSDTGPYSSRKEAQDFCDLKGQ